MEDESTVFKGTANVRTLNRHFLLILLVTASEMRNEITTPNSISRYVIIFMW